MEGRGYAVVTKRGNFSATVSGLARVGGWISLARPHVTGTSRKRRIAYCFHPSVLYGAAPHSTIDEVCHAPLHNVKVHAIACLSLGSESHPIESQIIVSRRTDTLEFHGCVCGTARVSLHVLLKDLCGDWAGENKRFVVRVFSVHPQLFDPLGSAHGANNLHVLNIRFSF